MIKPTFLRNTIYMLLVGINLGTYVLIFEYTKFGGTSVLMFLFNLFLSAFCLAEAINRLG